MARESPAQSAKFRRRVPLELTAEELALLEREQRRFGSKRATLVAGLEALARALGLEAELAQAVRERDEARALAESGVQKARKAEGALAKAKQEAGAAKRGKSEAERRQQERGEESRLALEALEDELAEEEQARARLEAELAALEAELPLAIHCPRCAKWAPRSEWASKAEGEFELLCHERCGFHPQDGLRARSVFAYRRRA